MSTNTTYKIGDGVTLVTDRDGDSWRRADDGYWCCQEPCPTHGGVPHEDCADHDHRTASQLIREWGPVAEVQG